MIWLPIAMAAGGAAMGMVENKRKAEQQERSANAAADATAVSWATRDGKGQIPQIQWNDSSMFGDAFKGGMGGFMMGSSINGMQAPQAATQANAFKASTPMGEGLDWNSLQGSGYGFHNGDMQSFGGQMNKPTLFAKY